MQTDVPYLRASIPDRYLSSKALLHLLRVTQHPASSEFLGLGILLAFYVLLTIPRQREPRQSCMWTMIPIYIHVFIHPYWQVFNIYAANRTPVF